MDRRNFIKSTGIGLVALLLAGQLPKIETPKAKVPEVVPKPHGNVEWFTDQNQHMLCAKVYGYNKKTLEVEWVDIAIPHSELEILSHCGEDYIEQLKAEIIGRARYDLREHGCVPL